MKTLYHGSNVRIEKIDLEKCRSGKDFGKGFYLNPNFDQAYKMTERAKRINREGKEVVSAFEFDDSILDASNDLKIKIFSDYSKEWADFVVANRKNRTVIPIHPYDIVIGPIADDNVGTQIYRYSRGFIGLDKLISELKFEEMSIQYFFGTEKAIKLLKKI